jgi:hypothetical protein
LIARKIADPSGFNCNDVQPFYAACRFNELSRGFVLLLLNACFGTAISQCHNSIFYAKINDHGIRWGNTGQLLAQWQRLVASKVALDILHWAMCPELHRCIVMAIKKAHNGGTFVCRRRLFYLTNCS